MKTGTYPKSAVRKVTILALTVLLLGLTPYPRAFTEAMRRAEAHRAAREYGAALKAYEQAAHADPKSPLPWLRMGQVLLVQHRLVEATIALREAVRLGGSQPALLALGESYAGREDWATAIQTWLRAQAMAPEDARVHVALARGAIAQSRFDQAMRYLIEAQQLDAANIQAQALLGRLLLADDSTQATYHLQQANDGAMLAVLAAAESETDPARCELLLGAVFLRRGELPLARRHFERAVTASPGSAEAHAYLAHTLDQLGETVAARELLALAQELDPDSALVYYFLGVHHRLVGNVADAQAALWEALLRDPENAALRVEMAETFADQSNYVAAEEWYQGAVEVVPGDVEFHILLTRFYLDRLYRVEEGGLSAAQAAVVLAPDDARTHDLLGWAHHLAGEQVQGSISLHQALDLDPNLVSAHYHLGSLYASIGRSDLACHHLQRAADLDVEGYFRRHAEMLVDELDCILASVPQP